MRHLAQNFSIGTWMGGRYVDRVRRMVATNQADQKHTTALGESGTEAHCNRVAAWAEELCRATRCTREEAAAVVEAARSHHRPDVMHPKNIGKFFGDLGFGKMSPPANPSPVAQSILEAFAGRPPANPRIACLARIVEAANLLDEELEYAPFAELVSEDNVPGLETIQALVRKLRLASVEDLIIITDRLPVYPTAAMQLYRMLCRDEFDLNAATEAASMDQVIAGRLIDAANSAYYHPRERIRTLERAILYIGTNDARRLLLATSIQPLFSSARLKTLWSHALEAAQVAEMIAASSRNIDPVEAFLAGLLHDIGKLAICQLPQGVLTAIDRLIHRGCQPTVVETVVCGFDHARAAEHVLRKWKFADDMVEGIRHHHQPERTTSCLASVLYLTEFCTASEEDLPSQARLSLAFEKTGLTPQSLDGIMQTRKSALTDL